MMTELIGFVRLQIKVTNKNRKTGKAKRFMISTASNAVGTVRPNITQNTRFAV
jgi:hypothetical protein